MHIFVNIYIVTYDRIVQNIKNSNNAHYYIQYIKIFNLLFDPVALKHKNIYQFRVFLGCSLRLFFMCISKYTGKCMKNMKGFYQYINEVNEVY